MGTAEFYRVVESLPEVIDSLVVDTSSATGEGDLLLFVVLADGADESAVTGAVKRADSYPANAAARARTGRPGAFSAPHPQREKM